MRIREKKYFHLELSGIWITCPKTYFETEPKTTPVKKYPILTFVVDSLLIALFGVYIIVIIIGYVSGRSPWCCLLGGGIEYKTIFATKANKHCCQQHIKYEWADYCRQAECKFSGSIS